MHNVTRERLFKKGVKHSQYGSPSLPNAHAWCFMNFVFARLAHFVLSTWPTKTKPRRRESRARILVLDHPRLRGIRARVRAPRRPRSRNVPALVPALLGVGPRRPVGVARALVLVLAAVAPVASLLIPPLAVLLLWM